MTMHNTLSLRKVYSASFAAEGDTDEPLVSSMAFLTTDLLLAADFNNSCLKLFKKEKQGDWMLIQVKYFFCLDFIYNENVCCIRFIDKKVVL